MDFTPIKLNVTIGSSRLQRSFEDVIIVDDASTQPTIDDPKSGENLSSGFKKGIL